jgi:hypothetical protein
MKCKYIYIYIVVSKYRQLHQQQSIPATSHYLVIENQKFKPKKHYKQYNLRKKSDENFPR